MLFVPRPIAVALGVAVLFVSSVGHVSATQSQARSISASIGVRTGWVIESVDGVEALTQLEANSECQKGQIHDPNAAAASGFSPLATLGDVRVVHSDTFSLTKAKSRPITNRFLVGVVAGSPVTINSDGVVYSMRPCIMLTKARKVQRGDKFTLQIDGQMLGPVTFNDLSSGLFFSYDNRGRLQRAQPTNEELESIRSVGYFVR